MGLVLRFTEGTGESAIKKHSLKCRRIWILKSLLLNISANTTKILKLFTEKFESLAARAFEGVLDGGLEVGLETGLAIGLAADWAGRLAAGGFIAPLKIKMLEG